MHHADDFIDAIARRVADYLRSEISDVSKPDFLSPRTIARILDCSESEVRKQLQMSGIRTVRFGNRGYRVPREEFEKHLTRWKNGGELWD